MIRILIGAVSRDGWIDPDVVSGYPRNQGSFRGNGPACNVRFQKIIIVADESCGSVVALTIKEFSRTDQRRYMRCQGRGRIPTRLFPSVLRRSRAFPNEKSRRTTDHLERMEVGQSTAFP